MIDFKGTRFVPIGCSCIVQFQLDFVFPDGARKTGLFDSNIVSPDTSIKVLEQYKKGQLLDQICNPSNYAIEKARFDIPRLRNMAWPVFYYWHEKQADYPDLASFFAESGFVSKQTHILENTFSVEMPTICVWSNIQPNLKMAIAPIARVWDEFVLTKTRYMQLQSMAKSSFNATKTLFFAREQDCDPSLYEEDNVHILNLPESEDFRGPENLFSDHLRSALL